MVERKHIEAIEQIVDRDEQYIDVATTAYLRAAINKALAALEESPWRSMDSAPRDGTAIIIAGGPAFSRWSDVSWWRDGRWCSNDDSYFVNEAITHWMPLPAAPVTDNAASEGGEGER